MNALLKKQTSVYLWIYWVIIVGLTLGWDLTDTDDIVRLVLVVIATTGISILVAIRNAVSVIKDNCSTESIFTIMIVKELVKNGVLEINPDADIESIDDIFHIVDSTFSSLEKTSANCEKTK